MAAIRCADRRFEGLSVQERIRFEEQLQQRTDLRTFVQTPGGQAEFKWNPVAAAYVAKQLTQQQAAAFEQHLRSCGLCEQDVEARRRGETNGCLGYRGGATCRYSRLMTAADIERQVRELTSENPPPVRRAPGTSSPKSPASVASPMGCNRIEADHVVERYLAGQLSPSGVHDFEEHYVKQTGAVRLIEQVLRLKEGLAALRESGELDQLQK